MSTLIPSDLKVVELRAELSKRELPTKGKKDELIARLNEALELEKNATHENVDTKESVEAEKTPLEQEVQVEKIIEETIEVPAVQETQVEQVVETPVEQEAKVEQETKAKAPIEEIVKTHIEETLEKPVEEAIREFKETIVQVSEKNMVEKVVEDATRVQKDLLVEKSTTETVEKPKVDNVLTEEMNTDRTSKRKLSEDNTTHTEEKRPRIEDSVGCSALFVKGFVRPLINRAVQELFGKYGKVKRFWIDFIKTHSYVIYETEEEASLAFDNINGIVFPEDTGKTLTAGKLTLDQAEKLIDYEQAAATNHLRIEWESLVEKVKAGEDLPPTPGSKSNVRAARGIGMGQINKQLARAVEPVSNNSRQITINKEAEQPKERSLDDLFRKTEALPHLYYLPVSDEEAKIKLNSIQKL